ncbi:MAG: SUMF1/EgtB/PvdO family nonheme iron enzyme [Anaerolineae bacterium]|nr:SUMF1/EgtB/PvdO family nonheme iron enzyme [Anaerolineae bacterium]
MQATPSLTIFLSYDRDNDKGEDSKVKQVKKALESAGHRVWQDLTDIKPGVNWPAAIEAALSKSDIVVNVLSKESRESVYVRNETTFALSIGKTVIPFRIDDCKPPFELTNVHYLDASTNFETALHQLLELLATHLVSSSDSSEERQLELDYLERIVAEYAFWQKHYIELKGTIETQYELQTASTDKSVAEESTAFDNIADAISELKQVLILGEPGAGKSTTINNALHSIAERAKADQDAPLPILLTLGTTTDEDIFDQLQSQLGAIPLQPLLDKKRVVLLFDGLNELPPANSQKKLDQINQFVNQATADNTTVVVTCRDSEYVGQLNSPIQRLKIIPLDPLRIYKFVSSQVEDDRGDEMFWRLAGDSARETWQEFSDKVVDNLELFWLENAIPRGFRWTTSSPEWQQWLIKREQILRSASLLAIASNPYLLSLMILLFNQNPGYLVNNRMKLFDAVIDLYFQREGIDQSDKTVELGLSLLSYKALAGDVGTNFPPDFVEQILPKDKLLKARDAKILVYTAEGQYRFAHQLLQEYFAALYLHTEISKSRPADYYWHKDTWWLQKRWDETVILMLGLYKSTTPIVEWLQEANPALAVRCMQESATPTPDETKRKLKEHLQTALTDLRKYPHAAGRAAIGRDLSLLGWDERPGIGALNGIPDISWVFIPDEGVFAFQAITQVIAPYAISRYPITYGQFANFVESGAYLEDKYWAKGGKEWRGERSFPRFGWHHPNWHIDNHPVVGITWYEAMAYCMWLSELLDLDISLPTEYQWEKAARRTDDRLYPYGKTRDNKAMNVEATEIGRTSPVGIFPNGRTADQVEDMLGNVWELCLTDFDNMQNNEVDVDDSKLETIRRTMRGNSWYLERSEAKSTARFRFFQIDYDDYVGFRIVCNNPSALPAFATDER